MSSSLQRLRAAAALSGQGRVRKDSDGRFVSTTDEPLYDRKACNFTYTYGPLDLLDTGLEGLIGLPDGHPEAAMAAEHCNQADSDVEFSHPGYKYTTSSRQEWEFVTANGSAAPKGSESVGVRAFIPLSKLRELLEGRNAELKERGYSHMQLTLWEAIAARLYTGPMYCKYNAVLRSFSDAADPSQAEYLARQYSELCKGNVYRCGIFGASAAVVKLSKLQPVSKIYRGLGGGNLPRSFFEPNISGLRGGVEYGFMSTTGDRDVAMGWSAAQTDGDAMLLEITMTMSARGADMTWLSQYPHEVETLFPPLTGLDVTNVRSDETHRDEGVSLIVVEANFVIPQWLSLQQACERTPKFLDRFELNPGAPLHISRTAAVLAGSERVGDGKREVALKFMCEPAQVEAEVRGRLDLDPTYVVSVLELLCDASEPAISCAGLEHVVIETRAELGAALRKEVHNRRPAAEGGEAADVARYRYCLVLELAECNLSHALTHERFAGDWALVRKIGLDLVRCLAHLHDKNRIHADLKPLNVVRVGSSWQLIDLDVSCAIGAPFGDKVPSSGYCPPEMARVLRNATRRTGEVEVAMLREYDCASVAFDLWSLGCVIFHLCFGKTLHHTNHDDNISSAELRAVGEWGEAALNKAIYRIEPAALASDEAKSAVDLIRKLLSPTADGRLAHFSVGSDGASRVGVEMACVAEHPFFSGQSLQHDLLAKISLQVEQSYSLQLEMDSKLDRMLDMLNAQFKMLGTILQGIDTLAPKLIVFLPATGIDAAAGRSSGGSSAGAKKRRQLPCWLKHPRDWLNQRVKVFFVDPVRLSLAETNRGQGFELTFPKEWVARAMPYVKLGLTALKVAAVAGRLAGVPVPDVGALLQSQLSALSELKYEAIGQLAGMTNDPQLAAQLLDGVDQKCTSMLAAAAGEALPQGEKALGEQLNAPLQKSVKELDALLPNGWRDECGLVPITATDGTTEWVLPQDEREFRAKGQALLGARSEATDQQVSDAGAGGEQSSVAASCANQHAGHGGGGTEEETRPLLSGGARGGKAAGVRPRDPELVQLFEQVQLLRTELREHKAAGAVCPACEIM